MCSSRSFYALWFVHTLAILLYAVLDLTFHPSLRREQSFSMEPDLAQLGQVVHWGGRLLKENALVLLVGNALVLGGLAALVTHGLLQWWRRRPSRDERPSIYPPSASPSVPPPA